MLDNLHELVKFLNNLPKELTDILDVPELLRVHVKDCAIHEMPPDTNNASVIIDPDGEVVISMGYDLIDVVKRLREDLKKSMIWKSDTKIQFDTVIRYDNHNDLFKLSETVTQLIESE